MATQRSERNRTITLQQTEVEQYAGMCPTMCNMPEPSNSIFHGDTFEVMASLP